MSVMCLQFVFVRQETLVKTKAFECVQESLQIFFILYISSISEIRSEYIIQRPVAN